MEIIITSQFESEYNLLPKKIREKVKKQENIFRENPFHPSLHTEKLFPKSREIWSFRVDRKYRIIFKFLVKDKVLFLNTGPHDWIYNIKF